jgi:hypothetical protein
MKHLLKNNQGFTIFFAVLVASLALAIGLAIYDLAVRQLALSSVVAQSQDAFGAADTGAECALYWDSTYNGSGSAFATSSSSNPPTSGVICNNIDIAAFNTPPTPFQAYSSGWTQTSPATSPNAATTTFTITFPQSNNRCALVQVSKFIDSSGVAHTNVYSQGFSTCATGATNTVERELKVSY